VIHNAGDIAPKGDFVFKPGTVRVDVLPPVDTTDWTLEKMDEQVTEVRNLFLQALGQPEQTVKQTLEEQKTLPEDMRPEKAGKKPRATTKKKAVRKALSKAAAKGRQVAGKGSTKPKINKKATPSSPAANPKRAAKPKVASKNKAAPKTAAAKAAGSKKARGTTVKPKLASGR